MTALLLTLLLAQLPEDAAGEETPRLAVLSLEVDTWGGTTVGFERAVTPHLSISAGLVARALFPMGLPEGSPNQEMQEYTGAIRVLIRWHPQGSAPFGLWLAPMAAAGGSAHTAAIDSPFPSTAFQQSYTRLLTAGALVGFSGTIVSGAVFQVSGGVRADWFTYREPSGFSEKYFAVAPIVCLGVGWAF